MNETYVDLYRHGLKRNFEPIRIVLPKWEGWHNKEGNFTIGMKSWVDNNCEGIVVVQAIVRNGSVDGMAIDFELDSDAVAFKLIWLGK